MLSPYERLLLAYLGKQPDQVPVAIPPFPVVGVPELEESAGRANPHYPQWDRATRMRKAIAFGVRFATQFPEVCVVGGVGSGGHGDKALHLAQVLAPKLGRVVAFKESVRGGYAYAPPLIADLAAFDTDDLYVPDLRQEPALDRVFQDLRRRLDLEAEAYAGLEGQVTTGATGWASTRCVEDVVDQGLVSYKQFLVGMKLWPEKVHALCRVITDYVIAQLRLLEGVMGKITKLTIADHCTTFMSWTQAAEFWVPYVKRVTDAFTGVLHIYHNEGEILHLVDLIPAAGFDAYQVGPETDLAAVRAVVGDGLALFGNLDPVYTLPSASPRDVEAACQQAIVRGGRDGGFILSTGGGPPRSGAPLRNVRAMIRAAEKYGTYPLAT